MKLLKKGIWGKLLFSSPVVIISILTFFLTIILIPIIFVIVLVMGGGSLDEDGTIDSKLIDKYRIIQTSIENDKSVHINLEYIYGVDAVIREANFKNHNKIYVKENNMKCFYYNSNGENIIYMNQEKQKVYKCNEWNSSQISMFEYHVTLFNETGISDVSGELGFIKPISQGTITNEFQELDAINMGDGHTGIDMSGTSKIYPSYPGDVINVFKDDYGGNQITILHKVDGEEYITNYAHLSKVEVKVGDKVDYNTEIGIMGDTGIAYGVHLHFEIQKGNKYIHAQLENPRNYIEFPPKGESWDERTNFIPITKEHQKQMKKANISKEDQKYANYIIDKESSWNKHATNNETGAYGLCQALPPDTMKEFGEDYKENEITQLKWCDNYAKKRYEGWDEAYEFWKKNKWW